MTMKKDELVHGMTPEQVEELSKRFDSFQPQIVSKHTSRAMLRDKIADKLPDGANWAATGNTKTADMFMPGGQGGGRTMVTNQLPYQPEFASPDRQQYPVHRILANRYWRMFYKMDPVVGNCIELYSDLPWSNFELTGDGVEGEIRAAYEAQCRETQVLALLPYFIREYLVVGEVIPHTFFDDSRGIFTHIALHNPDQLEVIDAPFIKMDPILEFIPDDKLRSVLTSDNPELRSIKDKMPPELLSKLYAKQNISLSPLNATFIPRKLHPYDTRGTSIFSRMWRVLMLEDAIFNATLQMARRHAAPIKVAKLGNAATGWIPPVEQEKRLLELLAQAEQDPNAWLVYHYGVQFEAVGTSDRGMSITREWDIIERIKLVALGISKSFLHGEVSYASSATGMQVFLQRLKSLRLFFEQKWLYPKFFKPIAEINGWIKPKQSEVNHRYRIKRSSRELEEQNAYIIPKIVWDKSLDPQISSELISAMAQLEQLGVKFSKTSKMATVGYSFEEETKKIHREQEYEKAYLPKINMPAQGEDAGGGMPGGIGGGGMPPPDIGGDAGEAPVGGDGAVPPGVQGPPTPPISPNIAPAAKQADDDGEQSSITSLNSKVWKNDKYNNWTADDIVDVIDIIDGKEPKGAFFEQLRISEPFKAALAADNNAEKVALLTDFLKDHDYPDKDIDDLMYVLKKEEVIEDHQSFGDPNSISMLPDNVDSMSDADFANEISALIKKNMQGKDSKIITDNFLTGF